MADELELTEDQLEEGRKTLHFRRTGHIPDIVRKQGKKFVRECSICIRRGVLKRRANHMGSAKVPPSVK